MLPAILAALRNAAPLLSKTSGQALRPLAKGMQRAASFFGQRGPLKDWSGRADGPAPVPLSQTPFAGLQSPPETYRGQEINPPTGAPQPPSWGPPEGQGPPPPPSPPSPPIPPQGGSNALVPQGPFPIAPRGPGGKEDDTIHVLFPETGTALQPSPPSRKKEDEEEEPQVIEYDPVPSRGYDFDKTLPLSPPSPGINLQGQLSHEAPELLDTGTNDDLFQRAPVGSQSAELEYYRRTNAGFTPEVPTPTSSPEAMFPLPAPSPDGSMSFDWVNPEYARVEDKSSMEMASYFHALQGEIGKLRAEVKALKASMPVPSPVRIK